MRWNAGNSEEEMQREQREVRSTSLSTFIKPSTMTSSSDDFDSLDLISDSLDKLDKRKPSAEPWTGRGRGSRQQ
jgi:hypothetical protein